jgi:hypothetical protein
MIKSFKQFNEESKKEVVFTFGRFNPPTVGHGKLIAKVAAAAIGNQYRIYASQSSDPKKNPLEYKEKIRVMRKMFPKHGRNIIEDKNAKTAMHIASILHDQGFTKITMVVGSDRIGEFTKLLKKYNGIQGRHGFYDFRDGIEVISAGERDPDAEGVEGMSASKMRKAAMDGDFKAFSQGLPNEYGEDMTLFNLLRKRMGLKEMTTFRKHVQLPTISEKREQYISGEIFNVGDEAITESGDLVIVKQRKSNYIIDSEDKKYFIEKLSAAYGKGLSKSTKDKRQAQFNKQAKLPDDDPRSYKPAPGDARAKTKVSKYTKAYHKKYGKDEALEQGTDELVKAYKKLTPLEEKQIEGLKKKAEESGISYSILKQVFDRGMAAWKSGHRPGATPHQWAFARVNSFITGGKTRTTADKDLWAKVKGMKEAFEPHWMYDPETGEKEKAEKPEDHERLAAKGWTHEDPKLNENVLSILKTFKKKVSPQNITRLKRTFKFLRKVKPKSPLFKAIDNMLDDLDPNALEKLADAGINIVSNLAALKLKLKNEGVGKTKETWEDGFKRRVVKTTKPEHIEQGYKWRIKGKDRDEISIKLYKEKPDFEEFKKQMKRVAGHEFGS